MKLLRFVITVVVCFFFFKQKTAYEMRISDWSSDVCSSDLEGLRKASADALIHIGFDGYAVGGLAVGEGQEAMFGCLDYAPQQLPADKPRYLMGVGKPDDIVGSVERGIDMFDCVLPTPSARPGQPFPPPRPLHPPNTPLRLAQPP